MKKKTDDVKPGRESFDKGAILNRKNLALTMTQVFGFLSAPRRGESLEEGVFTHQKQKTLGDCRAVIGWWAIPACINLPARVCRTNKQQKNNKKRNKTVNMITGKHLVPGLAMGAALLALAATTSASRADTIVDNLSAASYPNPNPASMELGQIFTMPDSGDDILSSITLDLNFKAAASTTVDLYSVTSDGSVPSDWTLATALGAVSSASAINNYQVSLDNLNYELTLGNSYAIVVEANPDVTWNFTTDSAVSGGTAGTLPGNSYYQSGYGFRAGYSTEHQQMEIITSTPTPTPTPEPSTLALAGLGGIATFFMFRRRSVSMPPAPRKKFRHVR